MTTPIASLWAATDEPPGRPLGRDRTADVVVVGGGAAGLSIALRLQEQGQDVVVLERHRVGGGVTGGSTAKLTALHGTLTSAISRRHGPQVARAYVEANLTGLDDIRATINGYGIACELTEAAAINYATTEAGRRVLDEDAKALRAIGVAFDECDQGDLPFPVAGAIALAGQAHLHPRRWCEGLASAIGPDRIHETTRVLRINEDADGCEVVTDHGSVRADHAVIATHAPITDPRYLIARCQPHRSYALAARIEGPPPPDMYLSVDETVRSLRPASIDDGAYLIVAGEGHPVADEVDARQCLSDLEEWTRHHFSVVSVDHRWAAHDQMPSDNLPFIGRLTPHSRRWVATGFQKWGLTNSAVAAAIVSDGINGNRHRAAEIFDPARLRSTLTGQLAGTVHRVARRYIGDRIRAWAGRESTSDQVAALEVGSGVVVRSGRGGAAVHRDANGELHTVSAVCTHEGCFLRFNRAQVSWDCPCHGSRFSVDGEVLSGPAVKDLPTVELSPQAPH